MKTIADRRWFYPLIYAVLVVISMLPPITALPYDPRRTQDVIQQILMVAITPYQAWGWVFHVATLALVVLVATRPGRAGRVVAAYIGLNYLVIAALQTSAQTASYGFAVQTGALIATTLLGLLWLSVSWRGTLSASFSHVPRWRWLLLPLPLLVFWSPIALEGTSVAPNFNPLLLLTSPDYGLTYCFVTPVFLFLLILFYPTVDEFAFRVTAFNALLYGLFNLTHWFNPELVMMGVMHLPLLLLALVALLLPRPARSETPVPAYKVA